MSAEESHGSNSLTSFAASCDCSIPQPQLKNMAPRRKLTDTAKDLPPELYEKLKTPERETSDERKKRVQKIRRKRANRWWHMSGSILSMRRCLSSIHPED